MLGIIEIVTAVIGLFLLVSIVVFIFSIIRKWGKICIILGGLVVFLCSHLLLLWLVVFVETTKLPPLLNSYTLGILDLLESTRKKSSTFFHPFLDNTPPVPVQAGFDKALMNHSQPSQLQMFKVQHNRW